MLIATIVAILFLGGGGAWFDDELSQLKKNTKEVVESGEVRDEALNIIKEMKKLSSDQGKLAKSRSKQISSLLEDRTVGQAQPVVVFPEKALDIVVLQVPILGQTLMRSLFMSFCPIGRTHRHRTHF